MNIGKFSEYLDKLEKISSRNEITQILAELFKLVNEKEIDKVIYLSLGTLAPSYRGIIFNIADQMMIRAIALSFEIEADKVKTLYKQKGDLGEVSYELAKKKDCKLSVLEVYEKLVEVAREGGEGSQERRVEKLAELLMSLDPLSAKFVTRIPLGKLRLGFSDLTIIDALSWMENGDKSAKADLTSAYQVLPDVGYLAKKVKELGIKDATYNPKPVLGIPVAPMLAQRLNSPEEMIKKMKEVSVEPKFDGLRVQIHWKEKIIGVFTRNLHNIGEMFPELDNLGEHVNAKEVIFDAEAIGIDEETKKLLDFQTTMNRRRKHDIAEIASRIPVTFYVFDCLYKDGESLMNTSYLKRKEYLKNIVKDENLLKVVEGVKTTDPVTIGNLYKEKFSNGLEGIIVKRVDSNYVPGRTGWRWVKMKQIADAAGKLTDTVDCVVMGYSVGKGKRAGFGVGQFLVGVKDGEKFKTVTKVGTGLTDDQFKQLKAKLEKLVVKEMPKEYEVNKVLNPDYWVAPELVVEIAADDITKSPNHTAEYALRFPRLVNFREDKLPKDATTIKELEEMYKLQNK